MRDLEAEQAPAEDKFEANARRIRTLEADLAHLASGEVEEKAHESCRILGEVSPAFCWCLGQNFLGLRPKAVSKPTFFWRLYLDCVGWFLMTRQRLHSDKLGPCRGFDAFWKVLSTSPPPHVVKWNRGRAPKPVGPGREGILLWKVPEQ